MNTLLWWFILVCLIILITILSLFLCYSVFGTGFEQSDTNSRGIAPPSNYINLKRYKYGRKDVEDLTKIERDYQNFNSKFSFVNEVTSMNKPLSESSAPGTPRVSKLRKYSLLPDIHEGFSLESCYSVEDVMNEVNSAKGSRRNSELLPRRFSLVTEGMRKNSLAVIPLNFSFKPESDPNEGADTIDCPNPTNLETLRDIASVEDDAHRIEYEIDYFLGQTKNLKYFEINEKLIRMNLKLSDIPCSNDELRKRKKEVQVYINECKEKLNKKVI